MYDNGQGVPQDFQKAFKWISLPAEKGDAKAQFFLGCMYEDGQGVTQDYKQAIKWYTLAAEKNDHMAQSNLGHLYANEQTGKLDYIQAHKWFNITGAREKEEIEKFMTSNQISEAHELARTWINKYKDH